MIITVTKENIEQGVAKNCRKCPIALAVAALIRPDVTLQIDEICCILNMGAHHDTFSLPCSARKFINHFDKQQEVAPFKFELDIPTQYLQ